MTSIPGEGAAYNAAASPRRRYDTCHALMEPHIYRAHIVSAIVAKLVRKSNGSS